MRAKFLSRIAASRRGCKSLDRYGSACVEGVWPLWPHPFPTEFSTMSQLRPLCLALTFMIAVAGLSACDKEAGRKQETVGKVESGVGKVIGDKDLKKQGKEDKVVGGVKQGDLKGAVKDAKD
jgi:uncharacterized protein YjbJ (UPF0337 family)